MPCLGRRIRARHLGRDARAVQDKKMGRHLPNVHNQSLLDLATPPCCPPKPGEREQVGYGGWC